MDDWIPGNSRKDSYLEIVRNPVVSGSTCGNLGDCVGVSLNSAADSCSLGRLPSSTGRLPTPRPSCDKLLVRLCEDGKMGKMVNRKRVGEMVVWQKGVIKVPNCRL